MPHQTNNIAIFAHYDKHNLIDDYVVIYLQNLKKFCDKIIFVSDCALPQKEQQKIHHLTSDIIAEKHGEYDFGSWKRGFGLLREKYPQALPKTDKLIFANDSCYCVGGFDGIFKRIDQMPEIDTFGITDSELFGLHLQSYFFVFRKSVFLENFFNDFWKNLKKSESKEELIKTCEIGLSQLLIKNKKSIYALFGRKFLQDYLKKNQQLVSDKISETLGFYKYFFSVKKIYDLLYANLFQGERGCCYNDHFYLFLINGCPLIKFRLVGGITYSKKRVKTLEPTVVTYFWKKIIEKEIGFDSKIIQSHSKRVVRKVKKPHLLFLHVAKSYALQIAVFLAVTGLCLKFLI